jgi:hypothetical protein
VFDAEGVGADFLGNENEGSVILEIVGHLIDGSDFAMLGPTRMIPVRSSPIPSPINVANSASLFIQVFWCC